MGCTCDKLRFVANYKDWRELEKGPPPYALTETKAVVIRAQWEILKPHIANLGEKTKTKTNPMILNKAFN